MSAQLLLLLALAGPFCAFTRASPTIISTNPNGLVTQTGETAIFHTTEPFRGLPVITGPPPTDPKLVPQELTTEAVTVEVRQELITEVGTEVIDLQLTTEAGTEVIHPELTTEAVTEVIHQQLTTEAGTEVTHQELATEAVTLTADITKQTTAETEEAKTKPLLSTHASDPGTEAPTEEGDQTSTVVAETLTSGHVAGISIGVLIAIVFVIAIMIIMAKRMGKYSP